MKKNLSFFLLLAFIFAISCIQEKTKDNKTSSNVAAPSDIKNDTKQPVAVVKIKSDLTKLNISGSIKMITENDYKVKPSGAKSQKGALLAKRVVKFDEKGYLSEHLPEKINEVFRDHRPRF